MVSVFASSITYYVLNIRFGLNKDCKISIYKSNCSDIGVFLCFPFHFYDFSVECWNCPNSVVFVFHFIIILRLCFRKYDVVR
jgi:hypothetical protein